MEAIELAKKELGFDLENLEELCSLHDLIEKNPIEIHPTPKDGYGIMMYVVFDQIWVKEIKLLDEYFSKSYNEIKNQINLFFSNEEIRDFAIERNKEIVKHLQQNKWTHYLNNKNFHLLTNLFFMGDTYRSNFKIFDKKFNSFRNQYYPPLNSQISLVKKFREIVYEEFFYEFQQLLKLLVDAKMIHILRRRIEVSINKDSNSLQETPPNFDENKYPKVFKSPYGYELFRYLVKVDDEKIAPAWARKYFELLQDEKIIKKTAKPINFIRFIKSEYGIDLPELDKRASYDGEVDFLKDIEKDFKKKYNISRF